MKKRKILFIYTKRSSFVQRDIEILSTEFDIIEFKFDQGFKFLLPFTLLRQLIFLISNRKANAAVVQFGGYHSFLPVLFGEILNIKTLVIAGGVDCVYYPEIKYGYFGKFPINLFTRYSFMKCSLILPKHESLMYFKDTYNYEFTIEQGIKYFIPEIHSNYVVINNGFDENKFYKNSEKVKNTFITAAMGLGSETNFKLKGIDLILKAAIEFDHCKFTIIGGESIISSTAIPHNVNLLPELNSKELVKEFSKNEFYLQLSMSEGFPNSICEAMLCECIPIGSNVNSIPYIIGENGYILKKRSANELVNLIRTALNDTNKKPGVYYRNRIMSKFPLKNRNDLLLTTLISITS